MNMNKIALMLSLLLAIPSQSKAQADDVSSWRDENATLLIWLSIVMECSPEDIHLVAVGNTAATAYGCGRYNSIWHYRNPSYEYHFNNGRIVRNAPASLQQYGRHEMLHPEERYHLNRGLIAGGAFLLISSAVATISLGVFHSLMLVTPNEDERAAAFGALVGTHILGFILLVSGIADHTPVHSGGRASVYFDAQGFHF